MKTRDALTSLALVLVILAGCRPSSPPAPVTTPQAQTSAPVTALKSPNALASSGDTAWQKVVDGAKQEGKLTVYSFGMLGDIGIAIADAFKNKYGVSVDVVTGRGAETVEKIKTEQRMNKVVVDVYDDNATYILALKTAGFTVGIKDLPALRDKDVWRVDPLINDAEGHLLGVRVLPFTPWINTKLVKPEDEPKSYKDLLQPRWKGKIATGDPALTTADYTTFVTMMNHKAIDIETVRSFGNQGMTFLPGIIDVSSYVSRGEYAVNLSNSYPSWATFIKAGASVKPVPMEEGVVTQVSTIGVIKDSPHPNAALLFANWMASQEGQTVYAKALVITPVRKDVTDYSPAPMNPRKIITQTQEDTMDIAKKFSDKFLVQLWKKQ